MACTCAEKTRPDWYAAHAADFLNSDTCSDIPGLHQAIFSLMLHHAWIGPGLPSKFERLANRLKVDLQLLQEVMDGPVGEKWTECCGKLWNDHLEVERGVAERRSKKGKTAAAERWKGRKAMPEQCSSNAQAMLKQCSSNAQNKTEQNKTDNTRPRDAAPPPSVQDQDEHLAPRPDYIPEQTWRDWIQFVQERAFRLKCLGKCSEPVKQPGIRQALIQLAPKPPPETDGWIAQKVYRKEVILREAPAQAVLAWLQRLDRDVTAKGAKRPYVEAAMREGPDSDEYQAPGFYAKPGSRRKRGGAA